MVKAMEEAMGQGIPARCDWLVADWLAKKGQGAEGGPGPS
jgi:hypothetical protein